MELVIKEIHFFLQYKQSEKILSKTVTSFRLSEDNE
jgi:hypothetical protein